MQVILNSEVRSAELVTSPVMQVGVFKGDFREAIIDETEVISVPHGRGSYKYGCSPFSYEGQWCNGQKHGAVLMNTY